MYISNYFPKQHLVSLLSACALLLAPYSHAAAQSLEEILVTAELLEQSVLDLPNSVTVLDEAMIRQRNAQHLEDLLNLAPNVNFASGASRGRFIQIRGIGERSEFQEPIINSVGVMIDGIDFTGIATAAATLDTQQVEVLRGPQGTLFGANALAGLINVVSNAPSQQFSARLSASVEDYNGRSLSGVISAPISENTGYRVAVQNYRSDGYVENLFLDRDDTNGFNETTARARLSSQVTEALKLDATLFIADIDNGYDAFSLDNTRQTYSDQPGVDQQETVAVSLSAELEIQPGLNLIALASNADSDLQYSYDEDWSNLSICQGTPCDSELFGFDWFYSSFDQYLRQNDNTSLDVKLVSQTDSAVSWVSGLYLRDQEIDLLRNYTFNDGPFNSSLDTRNIAAYGQLDVALNTRWTVSAGLRLEQRDVNYLDNSGASVDTDESLSGGRIALEYNADSGAFYYALISRGYKPGGFNLDQAIPSAQREFASESMLNYELGIKNSFADERLQLQVALFYQDRDDIQSKQSIVSSIATGEIGGACPCNFTDFTDNAASGKNSGIEVEFNWLANEQWQVFGALGLLDTEFDQFLTFDHVNADRDSGTPFNLIGREQAHAPGYQFYLGTRYAISPRLSINASVEGKDEFFFSDRHEERSDAYQLVNLEVAYQADNYRIAVYGNNLGDQEVKTRGFGSFGNDPRNFYTTEPYNQFAAPRVVGIKASVEF